MVAGADVEAFGAGLRRELLDGSAPTYHEARAVRNGTVNRNVRPQAEAKVA